MKRLLSILLVLTLVIGCMFSLSSCFTQEPTNSGNTNQGDNGNSNQGDNGNTNENDSGNSSTSNEPNKPTQPEIPYGYTLFENHDLSFAYPETWECQKGSISIMMNTSGRNITVAYEAKTDLYDDLTEEAFNDMMSPTFSLMGITMSNTQVFEKTTTNNAEVVKITYKIYSQGSTMYQTLYITHTEEYTYTITITEHTSSTTLADVVYDTLFIKETD